MNNAVLYEKKEGVAIVTMNRPERLNAVNDEIRAGLREKLDDAAKDDEVKVIIVTGAGRGFCCLLYTSPSPRDATLSRMPSSA